MLSTFNCGVGFNIVVSQSDKNDIIEIISKYHACYEIGEIVKADKKIIFENKISW